MLALRSIALASVVALAAFAPAPTDTGVIDLYNGSDYVVTHVYISDCGTDDWEEDLLGAYSVLGPGESLEVELDTGCWDMMAVVEGDYQLDTYSIGVGPGDYHEWVISN